MNKKRTIVYTILFAIVIVGIAITMMYIKPYGGEVSLFHAFSPYFVGLWIGDLIGRFYRRINEKK
jgi:hypothetical protein